MAVCHALGKNNIGVPGVGLWPIFCFRDIALRQDPLHISELLEPGIRSLGYELVGVEYQTGGKGGGLLRV